MTILYRLPGHGWFPNQQTLEPEELYDFAASLRHRFTVTTVEEYDYLMGLSLVIGKTIPVDFDPTEFRRTNVTQLRILELNP